MVATPRERRTNSEKRDKTEIGRNEKETRVAKEIIKKKRKNRRERRKNTERRERRQNTKSNESKERKNKE